ncbi:GDP-L-galactose phosphorylase 2, partial [Ananas comosus]
LGVIPKDNNACRGSFTAEDGRSLLDTFLLSQVISGRKKFIVQLNNRWNAQFLKEFENNFLEPLGFLKSNYMKNCKEEILFCVCQGEKESSELLPLIVLPKDGVLIIANGNPVEYGHVYLVPYVSHQLPLFWDRKILGLVTQIAVEVNNSSFRVFLDNASTTFGHIHF